MITAEQLTQALLELKQSQDRTDEQMKKTDEKLARIGKMLGGVSNSQGEVAEEFFYNSIKDNPTLAGVRYDFIDKNVTRKKGKFEDEYDILLVNGKDVAIIEVKYKARNDDVSGLIDKKYRNFKQLYPEYKDYNHHLVLASFKIDDKVKKAALQNNVTILQRKGNIIETITPQVV